MTARRSPTPSQTVGPFFGFALPFEGDSSSAADEATAIRVEGQLLDGAGEPVADGLLEVWSGEEFARCRTDAEGAFHFVVAKPGADTIARGAPHLDVAVFARGLLRHLATRMYFPDEHAANEQDRVMLRVEPQRRQTLVARAEGNVLHFDIRLQGEDETVFFAL